MENREEFKALSDKNKTLQKEVVRLKSRLHAFEDRAKKNAKARKVVGKRINRYGSTFFLGTAFKKSVRQLFNEYPDVQSNTLADVAAYAFLRITRIGLFAFFIAALPLFLLWQQNRLLKSQNEKIDLQNRLFSFQNERVSEQTKLLNSQNKTLLQQNELFALQNQKVGAQTELLANQNTLFAFQNSKVTEQTSLLNKQSEQIDIQINLEESNRRSGLVFMMSNILDQIDAELSKDNNAERTLSPQLIGRIAALTQSLRPYRYWNGNQLIKTPLSPERGQLLLALIKSKLNPTTYQQIFLESTFANADLTGVNLAKANLQGINLAKANLYRTNLEEVNLNGANLADANMQEVKLSSAKAYGANLIGANLHAAILLGINFTGTHLDKARLSQTNLIGANFNRCSMVGINLKDAKLDGVILDNADLSQANLENISLIGAKLIEVNLSNAIVSKPNWLISIKNWNIEGINAILKTYEVRKVVDGFRLIVL